MNITLLGVIAVLGVEITILTIRWARRQPARQQMEVIRVGDANE